MQFPTQLNEEAGLWFVGTLEQLFFFLSGISRPRGYETFLMLRSASMKCVLLVNPKLLTVANPFLINIAEHESFTSNKYKNANNCLS